MPRTHNSVGDFHNAIQNSVTNIYPSIWNLIPFSSFLNFFLFFGCGGSLLLHVGFLLVAASRGNSLVVLHGLPTVVVSLVAEHRL